MAHSQVGLAGSPALCAVPASHLTRCQEYSQRLRWEPALCASVETRTTPPGKGGEGEPTGGGRTGSRTPDMLRRQGLQGLAHNEALRRFCSHCASFGSAGKRQELRFARLTGRKDGGSGDRFLPPTRTARPQCPPFAPTLTRDASAKASGGRSSLEALTGAPEQLAKESGGRRGWTCRQCVCGSVAPGCPCKAPRQPRAPTSIHFCASEKAGSGGGSGCRG